MQRLSPASATDYARFLQRQGLQFDDEIKVKAFLDTIDLTLFDEIVAQLRAFEKAHVEGNDGPEFEFRLSRNQLFKKVEHQDVSYVPYSDTIYLSLIDKQLGQSERFTPELLHVKATAQAGHYVHPTNGHKLLERAKEAATTLHAKFKSSFDNVPLIQAIEEFVQMIWMLVVQVLHSLILAIQRVLRWIGSMVLRAYNALS
jgi:hypothetical protein